MAGVIGSEAGGYATVTPTENYIGQALQNNEANAFKYREEKRDQQAKQAAAAKAKQDALDKQRNQDLEDNEKINAIKIKDSGISGINSALINGAAGLREKYLDAIHKYTKTGDKKYLVESSDAMSNLQSIANIPEAYKKIIDSNREGVMNGTIDEEEQKRITDLGDKIEKGFVVPKIENGVMSFDVFERDPQTGQLSKIAVNNMKGEELMNQLTPQKKFDKLKDIEEVSKGYGPAVPNFNKRTNENVTEVPDLENKIKNSVNLLFKDEAKLKKYAKVYGINKEVKDLSQEEKTAIADQYATDIRANFNRGAVPNMVLRDQALQEKNARLKKLGGSEKTKKPVTEPFPIRTGTETKTGRKRLFPTYLKGEQGPIKTVVVDKDGSLIFSIKDTDNQELNQTGIKNKAAFDKKQKDLPIEERTEYAPKEAELTAPTKAKAYRTGKNDDIIDGYVRKMINPTTGNYFSGLAEYKEVYKGIKNKSITTTAKTQAKTTHKKETPAERAIRIANQA